MTAAASADESPAALTSARPAGLLNRWRWFTRPAYGAEPIQPFMAYVIAQWAGFGIWFAYFFAGGAGDSREANILSVVLIAVSLPGWTVALAVVRHDRERLLAVWALMLPFNVLLLGVLMFADGQRVSPLPFISLGQLVLASMMFQPRYTIALGFLAAIAPAIRHTFWNIHMELEPIPYPAAGLTTALLIGAGFITSARTRVDMRMKRSLTSAKDEMEAQAAALAQALETTRLSEARFIAFSEHAPVALALFDPQGRPTFTSAFAEAVFSQPPPGEASTEEYERLQGIIRGAAGGKTATLEYRQTDRDGRTRNLSGVFFPVEGSGAGAILLDVTRERALTLQAMRVQQAETLSTLTGGIAHDFNNLLTVILSNLFLVESDLPEGSPARGLVDEIRIAGERGADLVRRLLLSARPRVERWETVDLSALVAEAMTLVRTTLGNVSVTVEPPPAALHVRGDFGSLEQVLINLLLNARDALGGEGKIHVSMATRDLDGTEPMADGTSLAGTFHVLSVRDSGPGIPVDVLPRIFDPFFTTKEVGKGTGLGLTTSAAMIRAHGGALDVESSPGRGTTFRVLLPAYDGDDASAVAPPGGSAERPG